MIRSFLEWLDRKLSGPTTYDTLEAYIVAGNPKDELDVERLERQFHAARTSSWITVYPFR